MPARIIYKKGDLIPNTRLTYQYELPSYKNRRQAVFLCSCGTVIEATVNWVRFLNITSCGCYRSELVAAKNTKHSNAIRGAQSGAYRSWQAMHQRVIVNPRYAHVKVCDRWSGDDGFTNFLADMGERPHKHTIERNDNAKGYEPSNCRWATKLEQAQNQSHTARVVMGDETHSIGEWCRIKGIRYGLVKERRRTGMTLEDSIMTPINTSKQRFKCNDK